MAHECPECYQLCYCDGDDAFGPAPPDCSHCDPFDDDDFDDDEDFEEELESVSILDPHTARCRVCGCTHSHPCPGGCIWAEPDLCSRCALGGRA